MDEIGYAWYMGNVPETLLVPSIIIPILALQLSVYLGFRKETDKILAYPGRAH